MSDCKVDPGFGYRLLEKGETVQPGDEFFVYPDQWERTGYPGIQVGQQGASAPYRRKLEAPAEIQAVGGATVWVDGQFLVETTEPLFVETYKSPPRKKIYIAGPMRGIRLYNFPAFDDAAERLYNQGWDPINPADIDRDCNFDPEALPECWNWDDLPESLNLSEIIRRDVDALLSADAVYVLPGYERSRGSRAEIALAEWLNLEVIYEAKEPEASVATIVSANAGLHEAAALNQEIQWQSEIAALEAAKTQEDILEIALRITRGDRQAQYGPPDQDFRRTAAMWNGLFGHMLAPGASFEPMHIALAMILLKASRQIHQRKSDNWVDIAGYARCGSICDQVA